MAFQPLEFDLKQFDRFLAAILDAHKGGQVSQDWAIELIERVVIAAAMDDEAQYKVSIWLGPSSTS